MVQFLDWDASLSYLSENQPIMIHFFRHIRKGLINQDRAGKYLLYAVGEIVLVVIGILIALQINNWNENRKIEQSEQSILFDLRDVMIRNIEQYEEVIEQDEKSREASLKLLHLVERPLELESISDSLFDAHIHRMNAMWSFNPELGLIKSIINSGKIEYIENKELRIGLSSLEARISDANEAQIYLATIRTDMFFDILGKSYVQDTTNKWIVSKEELVGPEFVFWLKWYGGIQRGLIIEEKQVMEFMRRLLDLIEESML